MLHPTRERRFAKGSLSGLLFIVLIIFHSCGRYNSSNGRLTDLSDSGLLDYANSASRTAQMLTVSAVLQLQNASLQLDSLNRLPIGSYVVALTDMRQIYTGPGKDRSVNLSSTQVTFQITADSIPANRRSAATDSINQSSIFKFDTGNGDDFLKMGDSCINQILSSSFRRTLEGTGDRKLGRMSIRSNMGYSQELAPLSDSLFTGVIVSYVADITVGDSTGQNRPILQRAHVTEYWSINDSRYCIDSVRSRL